MWFHSDSAPDGTAGPDGDEGSYSLSLSDTVSNFLIVIKRLASIHKSPNLLCTEAQRDVFINNNNVLRTEGCLVKKNVVLDGTTENITLTQWAKNGPQKAIHIYT